MVKKDSARIAELLVIAFSKRYGAGQYVDIPIKIGTGSSENIFAPHLPAIGFSRPKPGIETTK
jgi:hypothetical protein